MTKARECEAIEDEITETLVYTMRSYSPPCLFTVPTIDECIAGWLDIDGKQIRRQDERGGADSLCAIPFNVTGFPSMSVPCGFSKADTPMGMQITSGPFQEDLIFRVAHGYEQATDWHKRRPPIEKGTQALEVADGKRN